MQYVVPHIPCIRVSDSIQQLKRIRPDDGDLVGPRSDKVTVFLMHLLQEEKVPRISPSPYVPEFGGSGDLWAGELSQSVEEETVGGYAGEETGEVV